MLLCTVRDCRLPLQREGRRLFCDRGHSFDIARTGYLNLLQPQDRRSNEPGDCAAAVAARRRIHDRGVTRPLLEGIANAIAAAPGTRVLDAGCGEGFYLGELQERAGFEAAGIDISVRAIDAAARRYPGCEWVIANADRFVPYADREFSIVLSITGRLFAPEFRRVLRDGGLLLVAVPAPDDLIELRGEGRDRADRTLAMFTDGFTPAGRQRITTAADLDREGVQDVLRTIYRPRRPVSPHAMKVTFSFDLLLFRAV